MHVWQRTGITARSLFDKGERTDLGIGDEWFVQLHRIVTGQNENSLSAHRHLPTGKMCF